MKNDWEETNLPPGKKPMRRYSYVKAIGLSLYSDGFYRDVARRWKGLGIIFLMLMILIFGGGAAVTQAMLFNPDHVKEGGFAGSSFQSLTNKVFLSIINQFPEIIIENGKARTDVPQPYVIQNPATRGPLMIIDTTGKTTSLANSPAIALVTDKALIMKEGDKDAVRAEFSEMGNTTINKDILLPAMRWLPLVMLPTNIIYMFIFMMINAFVLGGIAYIFSGLMNTGLNFQDNIRLAVVTTTPILMVEALQAVVGMHFFLYPMLVYFCMHAAYLYHALDANRPGARNR